MFLLTHLWIILALPLLGSAINGLFGKAFSKPAVNTFAVGSVALAPASTWVISGGDAAFSVAVNVRPPGSVTTISPDGYVTAVVSPFKSVSPDNWPSELNVSVGEYSRNAGIITALRDPDC